LVLSLQHGMPSSLMLRYFYSRLQAHRKIPRKLRQLIET
jgi:hypothetical protein